MKLKFYILIRNLIISLALGSLAFASSGYLNRNTKYFVFFSYGDKKEITRPMYNELSGYDRITEVSFNFTDAFFGGVVFGHLVFLFFV